MNYSPNQYRGALDQQIFDFDGSGLGMTTANGYSNSNSNNNSNGPSNNNPSALHYNPEAASLLSPGVYNPHGTTEATNAYQPQHTMHRHQHSTQHHQHHTMMTAAAPFPVNTTNHNNTTPAPSPGYMNMTGQLQQQQQQMLQQYPYPSTEDQLAALQQMAASVFDPVPMGQMQQQQQQQQRQPHHRSHHHHHSSSSRQQQQQHPQHHQSTLDELFLMTAAGAAAAAYTPSHRSGHHPSSTQAAPKNSHATPPPQPAPWMQEINLSVPSLALEPLTGIQVTQRIANALNDVAGRYIPCVDFLVHCQQELRKGLQTQQTQRRYRGNVAKQFYQTYIDHLPQRFYAQNQRSMEINALNQAVTGLQKLKADAKAAINQGSDAVKNTFLGGMKEGESWGLRRWLSKNGNALSICTDLECILRSCKELDKSKDSTKRLAAFMRPLAKQSLEKLTKDIPASYQERSAAHPYLPFFHRLEAVLRNMSQFDPEDDGVICLDSDSDDDDVQVVSPPPKRKAAPRKRKADPAQAIAIDDPPAFQQEMPKKDTAQKRVFDFDAVDVEDKYNNQNPSETTALKTSTTTTNTTFPDDGSSSGESDVDSVIQIVKESVSKEKGQAGDPFEDKDWMATLFPNNGIDEFGDLSGVDDEYFDLSDDEPPSKRQKFDREWSDASHRFPLQPTPRELADAQATARLMAAKTQRLADVIQNPNLALPSHVVRMRKKQQGSHFWDDLYAEALRLFAELLQLTDAFHFVDAVDEIQLMRSGKPSYSSIIKNPLCFRDILTSLIDLDATSDESDLSRWGSGMLPRGDLSSWSMWRGLDLLQAIDLVLVNSLAYGKFCDEGKSRNRSRTNEMRRHLWNRITEIVNNMEFDPELRKQKTPVRRSETSGFVVHKTKA